MRNNKEKPVILLQIGLADGEGDWVHGLEIARYIKENFGKEYEIVAFVCPGILISISDSKSTIDLFINKFKLSEDGNGKIILQDNPFFDCLYNGYTLNDKDYSYDNVSKVEKKYLQFIEQNPIAFDIKISHLNSTFSLEKITHKILFMSEYGNECDEPNKIATNLSMGIGKKCHGIRIYEVEEEANFWEKLFKQSLSFYNKILNFSSDLSQDYQEYHKHRKLLPADLRNKEAILEFIKINLIMYGANCDFYLPQKYIDGIDSLNEAVDRIRNMIIREKNIPKRIKMWSELQEIKKLIDSHPSIDMDEILIKFEKYCDSYGFKFNEIYVPLKAEIKKLCEEYNVGFKCITPNSIEILDSDHDYTNSIRIFSGFNLSDELYKGLYLYNRQAGAGISGDDGFSLAISGCNLPFHGKVKSSQVQEKLMKDMLELSSELNLKKLYNYINCFLLKGSIDRANFALEKMLKNSELLESLKEEYLILAEHIKRERNIFPKLREAIFSINALLLESGHKKRSISYTIN